MCGIVGIIGPSNNTVSSTDNPSWASYDVYRGLLTLQHRGQDAAGILSYDESTQEFFHEKDQGLVAQVFNQEKLERLRGNMAIGHTRYVTVGNDDKKNLQPLVTGFPFGVGMVHNGNILNYHSLTKKLLKEYQFQVLTNNDLEIFLGLFCQHLVEINDSNTRSFNFEKAQHAVNKIFNTVVGAYAVIGIIAGKGMFAFRDPQGIRPLCLGKKNNGNGNFSYCLTSETVAMNFLKYEYIRDIQPGEMLFIDVNGNIQNCIIPTKTNKKSPCMFEWVYFSGAESSFEGKSIYSSRLHLGKLLALKIKKLIDQNKINPDIIVPVPDTSRTASIALAEELRIPYREALIKNRYVHRSFILDSQVKRENAVELKLSPVKSEIKDKNILLIDDSIVRGTTSKKIIKMLKKHGAKNVTLASTCPPIRYPCYYGIDFPTSDELIASQKNEEQVAESITATHVIYLDELDLMKAIGINELCLACLNNNYPTSIMEGKNFSKKRKIDQNNNHRRRSYENSSVIWQ